MRVESIFRTVVDAAVPAALEAVRAQEAARVVRVREVLFGILGQDLPDLDIDVILLAASQADSIRAVAQVAGTNIMGECLFKLADELDGTASG